MLLVVKVRHLSKYKILDLIVNMSSENFEEHPRTLKERDK